LKDAIAFIHRIPSSSGKFQPDHIHNGLQSFAIMTDFESILSLLDYYNFSFHREKLHQRGV
jgi:hypothetical protein